MRDPLPQTIRLSDYQPPAWLAPSIDLTITIDGEIAEVLARTRFERNPASLDRTGPLVLDGDAIEPAAIMVNGAAAAPGTWHLDQDRLIIEPPDDAFELTIRTLLKPAENTQLMGLYASQSGLFTQCEAQGFRRITFALDRPDVMSRYTVTLHAERTSHPVLLSNGNFDAGGDAPGGRHWTRWVDPFPKPSYLFALVAGRLDVLEDHYITLSGRRVGLFVYVEPGKLDQCAFAMEALKKAARWDETVFGREFDLERYSIVAVGDFNMGAMENKGLNIFNTKFVLARPDIATDKDFENIDRVVAHEYFHNWTGNRVTCRDWFQLSLKEGLTVFRDQEFGADHYSRPVQRIQEVRTLRAAQFPEDAGPMAHPIRPAAYMEISNFYTATVYEKGAEVVRMIHTLLGPQRFRAGMDLYFARHDGQAVTTEDFVSAMADASGVDLVQFSRWYESAGTPRLAVTAIHDAATATLSLTVRQSSPVTAYDRQNDTSAAPASDSIVTAKAPLHIPLAIGLVGRDGRDLGLRLAGEPPLASDTSVRERTRVLSVTQAEQTFVFHEVPERPVPSLLREFSAPVILDHEQTVADLAHLMAHDSNAFARWEAGQRLAAVAILGAINAPAASTTHAATAGLVEAIGRLLEDALDDPAFAAEAVTLPSEASLAEQMATVDPEALHQARRALRQSVARAHRARLLELHRALAPQGPYSPTAASAGRRSLRNAALGFLLDLDHDQEAIALCNQQFDSADNMTDAIAALGLLAGIDHPSRLMALEHFATRWQGEALVMDKWFAAQATSRLPATLDAVRGLMHHAAFDIRNPNKVRALIGSFCHANHRHFHAADGSGYAFCAAQVIALDALNPQVAARLARAFDRWRRFDAPRVASARQALVSIQTHPGLSRDVTEIIARALA